MQMCRSNNSINQKRKCKFISVHQALEVKILCNCMIISWKCNLRKLAAEILSIPASSASSKGAFSAGTRVQCFNWNMKSLTLFWWLQVCSSQRLSINPQTISDQMMINLIYEDVQDYKVTVGITTKYTRELWRLVDIKFPYEMEGDTNPPVH